MNSFEMNSNEPKSMPKDQLLKQNIKCGKNITFLEIHILKIC